MNELDLIDALDARVHDIPVGAAPIDTMTRSARSTRRRRGMGVGLAAAAVVAGVAFGSAALLGGGDGADRVATAAEPPAWQTPPTGMRYVGLGHAAITVPAAWPDNATNCGTPERSTVIIDQGAICLALVPFPKNTDSVEVRPSYEGEDFSAWTPVEVDGAEALRSPVEEAQGAFGDQPTTYAASLYLPGDDAVFRAMSSIAPANVDDLLDDVAVFDDAVAVPGFQAVSAEAQQDAAASYLALLDEQGLVGEQVDQLDKRAYPPGFVIGTDPVPGTLVAPGATVRVTVAR